MATVERATGLDLNDRPAQVMARLRAETDQQRDARIRMDIDLAHDLGLVRR
jgi:hypothetical protein